MKEILVNKGMVFSGNEFYQPRMKVENQKLGRFFPQFNFLAVNNKVTSIKGLLTTNYNNSFEVRISMPQEYPYEIPHITPQNFTVEEECEHKYTNGNICVMRPESWKSIYSLAFIVARTAIWLNKYEQWRNNGRDEWPGLDAHDFE